ncbi:MAG: selenocysteine-specific translation elongation factor [Pirellulales bacterium]|nr:selenocysteine-specific translation elongation factor [Pirellulales bacterium]
MPLEQINLTLGTAGHIDHGKTALVKLLTGCETDRLREEKERGMSIDLGFAPCRIADLEVGIVDVPGHENFIKTMVAGASGMDAVMLVVAADDGVMPQTREHMEILTLLGVRHGFVALTKIDRVDDDHRQMVIEDTRAFLRGTFLDEAPICPVSSITGEGYDAYFTTLLALLESLKPKSLDGVFRLPVDRAFSARGHGTVVAGIPTVGSATIDDELVLLPEGTTSKIRQIEVYGRSSKVVKAGQCAALNVRHWDARRIRRGHVVTLPGFFAAGEWFVARLRLLSLEKTKLKTGAKVKFHTGTSEVTASVYPLESDVIQSGQECLVSLRTASPIVAGPGDPFIVRSLSPVRTIGGGTLIEMVDRRFKRGRPEVLDDLQARARAIADDRSFVEYAVKTAPSGAASESELTQRTKNLPKRLGEVLSELVDSGTVLALSPGLYIHQETLARLSTELLATVEAFHRDTPESPGVPLDTLREQSALDRPVLDGLIARLTSDGRLTEKDGRLALPGHTATFRDEDSQRLDALDALFRETGFKPPGMDEICDKISIDPRTAEKLLKILRDHGRLVLVEGALLFHADAIERARQILLDHFATEERLESVKFKYLLDTTRKFAIPLLDHFDRIGVTRRVGNTRYLKRR